MPGPRGAFLLLCCFRWHARGGRGAGGGVEAGRPVFPKTQSCRTAFAGAGQAAPYPTPVASHSTRRAQKRGERGEQKGRGPGPLFLRVFSHTPLTFLAPQPPPLPLLRAPHPARTPAQCAPVMKVRPLGAREGARRVGVVSLGGIGGPPTPLTLPHKHAPSAPPAPPPPPFPALDEAVPSSGVLSGCRPGPARGDRWPGGAPRAFAAFSAAFHISTLSLTSRPPRPPTVSTASTKWLRL